MRGYEWAKERNMNAFLSVTRGSAEPPVFLELTYRGAEYTEKPLAIVGGYHLKDKQHYEKVNVITLVN